MIVKTIHYCWFGRNPKPELVKKCIDSWKKNCPEYEIKEWNEDNFDVNCCDYVREAYEAKKWAFVSDYCRFFVLFQYGGIYLDTDVELLKTLEQLNENFVGFESPNKVNSGLIRGAKSGDLICKHMLESYSKSHFRKKDGTLDLLTVCDRETEILCSLGLKRDNSLQDISGTTVYPSEFFNPMDMETGKLHITDNTVSIHHYAASWISKKEQLRGRIAQLFYRVLGKNKADKVRKILGRKR